MLLTGWVIFIVCSVALVKYLYFRFVKKGKFGELEVSSNSASHNLLQLPEGNELGEQEVTSASHHQNGTSAITKKLVETISGPKSVASNKPQAPIRRKRIDKSGASVGGLGESFDEVALLNANGPCTGSDPDVVEFINNCYEWGFTYKGSQRQSWDDTKEMFIRAVNKTLRDEDLKVKFHLRNLI
jgi:hypothetical protein